MHNEFKPKKIEKTFFDNFEYIFSVSGLFVSNCFLTLPHLSDLFIRFDLYMYIGMNESIVHVYVITPHIIWTSLKLQCIELYIYITCTQWPEYLTQIAEIFCAIYSKIKANFHNLDQTQMALCIIYCSYSEDVTKFCNEKV